MTVEPCVGCEETIGDGVYCSFQCLQEDDGRVMESPITSTLYYVTEWEEKGDDQFVALEKEEISFGDEADASERDDP